jgi:hypothetical protein
LVTTQKKFVHCPENFSCPIDGGSIPSSVLMIETFLSVPKKVQLLFEKISIIDQKCFFDHHMKNFGH